MTQSDLRRSKSPVSRPLPDPSQSSSSARPPSLQPHPPQIPPRHQKEGSTHTAYFPPNSTPNQPTPRVPSPPAYHSYHEPVALSQSPSPSMPPLEDSRQRDVTAWGDAAPSWHGEPPPVGWGDDTGPTWDAGDLTYVEENNDKYKGWKSATVGEMMIVDPVEDQSSEDKWWDTRLMQGRPGPGCLPPKVGSMLHVLQHQCSRVVVSYPDLVSEHSHPPPPPPPSTSTSPSSSTTAPHPHHSNIATYPPPTAEEVRLAIPHPHAHWCTKQGGWIYHHIKHSTVLPSPLHLPRGSNLPENTALRKGATCPDPAAEYTSHIYKTHHFHHYPQSVAGSSLDPPFIKLGSRWEGRRRKTSMESMASKSEHEGEGGSGVDPRLEVMLDLWLCCQCSTQIICSGEGDSAIIPSVVDRRELQVWVADRMNHPPLERSPIDSVMIAFETILRILENFLFKQNIAAPKVGNTFQSRVGWNEIIKNMFTAMGFDYALGTSGEGPESRVGRFNPPKLDEDPAQRKVTRGRLLRAWVEMSLEALDWRRKHEQEFQMDPSLRLWVAFESVREETLREIGAHSSQLKPNPREMFGHRVPEMAKCWDDLGLTAASHSGELVTFGYRKQAYCDPGQTPLYFAALTSLERWAQQNHHQSADLISELVAIETSRGRWTGSYLQTAAQLLGLTSSSTFEEGLQPERIKEAWLSKIKELNSSSTPVNKQEVDRRKHDLKDAFKIVSESTGKEEVVRSYEETISLYGNGMMDATEAYITLEIPHDWDDESLITVYHMRLEETPRHKERMRSALMIIAEDRGSERLKTLALTGSDAGPPPLESASLDWPRGLLQLGNTCYLNSLLQYFYTIKELRDAISSLDHMAAEVSEEDIKQDRVGGRLVTRKEVERSKKFVSLLRELFWQLQYSQALAIKPEIELAKLALVTSKDEEDDVKSEGSAVTNASSLPSGSTLVDEPMAMGPLPDPSTERAESQVRHTTPTDLGKVPSVMDLDSQRSAEVTDLGFVLVDHPRSVAAEPNTRDDDMPMLEPSQPLMSTSQPPPLPPRKAEPANDGVMMFGKQHDVSECMDNCMFQIEAAMKFGVEKSQTQLPDSIRSVVKNLFYGKIRQRITPIVTDEALTLAPAQGSGSMHEKEDLFSQLLVNVAHEGFDLYDGLSSHFDDTVEFEGKQARMETTITALPPLLQIQLKRVQFNRETMAAYKSNAYVKFGESLFIDRFLDNVNPDKKAFAKEVEGKLNEARERLTTLSTGINGSYERSISNTFGMLAQQGLVEVESAFLEALKGESEHLKAELAECREEVDAGKTMLEEIWSDERKVEYELCSVFIHRGSSPSFGHYFFYSRDLPDHPDRWLKYNDQDVSTVPKSEVLADTTGSTANPYLLVFARKGHNIINTVHRSQFDDVDVD